MNEISHDRRNIFQSFKRRTTQETQDLISQILLDGNAVKSVVTRVQNTPPRFRLQYAKSLMNPSMRALSVKMKCYECVGFESVEESVGHCNVRTCPLWLHRPFQDKSK